MSTRTTKISIAIYELISKSNKALSHHDIQKELDGLCNRVTIYRVLEKLLENGKIHRAIDTEGISRYASCKSTCNGDKHHHNHIHFSCKNCKEVICLEDVVPIFSLPNDYEIHEVNFTISGICNKCKNDCH